MRGKNPFESWQYHLLLLLRIGISNVGDWIYLISLNLLVLNMTDSPFAVSILYMLKPLAALLTNAWSGSVIDRFNKRNLMIMLDVIRAVLIAILPFCSSIGAIYFIVFFICIASAVFGPVSMTYITQLTPPEQRQRFNSLRSLMDSGGFLIGPAVAGALFLVGTPVLALYINSLALLFSGAITLLLPNVETQLVSHPADHKGSFQLLKNDWKLVMNFSYRYVYITLIYFLFSCMMVIATAVDSLEAAFAKEVLALSESEYGFLVSVAGGGVALGAIVNAIFSRKLATSWLIGFGAFHVAIGYMIYACSSSFSIAALGFFILSVSLSFANTGFYTFYQNNIPVSVMGRVGSIYGFIEAIFLVITTAVFGMMAQLASIQSVVMIGAFLMLLVTSILCALALLPAKKKYYSSIITETIEDSQA
ncbi:hypothetical protein AT864_03340 [Anoxybacillus sp. P3H1B]|uniref:MFS transporter n=1 Tax=Anoxybacillus sp. P3H1B TaxID=1769293 RepID=UPI0007932972|nr:MFS transporter [Anoxybacillus sp. P3H1B]KXG08392.1 hypothetical protein AT864_03340 [Anoxybacillus sp. P3H1B]